MTDHSLTRVRAGLWRLAVSLFVPFAVALSAAAQTAEPPRRSDPPSKEAPPKGTPAPSDKEKAESKAKSVQPKLPETAAEKARQLQDLYAHLATAEDAQKAARTAAQIERLWLHSGSDTVNLLMQRAAAAFAQNKHPLAAKLLDYVVELAPDYPEGFNRRAFVHFAMNDAEKAVGDLRRALALDPNHYKALDGLSQIWRETGNKRGAHRVLRQLLDIHPFAPGAKQAFDELAKEVEGQGI